MKILVADALSELAIAQLQALGADVTVRPDLTAEDLPDVLGETEILIVRSTPVTYQAIETAPSLSLIIQAGTEVNTIDIRCASMYGIHVANCPDKHTDAVAELTIGLLIAADRGIVNATNDLRAGQWRKKAYSSARGLTGRVLGIIGLGRIGHAVARRAQGLEMHVAAWSRSLTPAQAEELGIKYCESPEQVAELADAVSIHLAATPTTSKMIGWEFFNRMKPNAIFINTADGDVVDMAALREAIQKKGLRVGLDVHETEPAEAADVFVESELVALATCTPGIGASTFQATEAIAAEVVNIVKAYRNTGTPLNVVNKQKQSPAVANLVMRCYNKVGVLAEVLDELRNANINIEEMQAIIFEGGEAASCTLRLDDRVSPDLLTKISRMHNIIKVKLF